MRNLDRWPADGGPARHGNFFEVLGVGAARGLALTPSDDQGDGRAAIVLSHNAWVRHFASDPAVHGRPVLLNGTPVLVFGVMPDGFGGLAVAAADFWAPLSLLGAARRDAQRRDHEVGLHVVGRLQPGVSRGQALAELLVWDGRRRASGQLGGRPEARLVLEPRLGTIPRPAEAMVLFAPLLPGLGLFQAEPVSTAA